jgi:hypothetical protein
MLVDANPYNQRGGQLSFSRHGLFRYTLFYDQVRSFDLLFRHIGPFLDRI